MNYLEKIQSRLRAAQTLAAVTVWLGWVAAALSQDESKVLLCYLPKTGGKLLLSGHSAEAQTRHIDFVVRDSKAQTYFFFATSEVSAHRCVTLGSHFCVNYSGARKGLLRKTFVMEELELLPTFVFVGHEYVQHTEGQLRGSRHIRYRSYLAPKNHALPNAVAFAYGNSIASGSEIAAVSLEGGPDQ